MKRARHRGAMKFMMFLSLMMSCVAGIAAQIDGTSFERVVPSLYADMLRKAKLAYGSKRYDEAFRLFQRTACAGDKESQSAIGRMYLLGQGTARDDLAGYAWLSVSAETAFASTRAILRTLDSAMQPEQKKIAGEETGKYLTQYGLAATNMSCGTSASRGGHIIDQIVCTPRMDGNQFLLKRCLNESPH